LVADEQHQVAIVGTGFGGIAVAVRLLQSGIQDFVMLERAADIGGVWRDNDYPGAAVDVQSQLYSFSFAPSAEWRHVFAKQPEIHTYLRQVVDDFALGDHIQFNVDVEKVRWDGSEGCWQLRTTRGECTARHVVIATGVLADPLIPALTGLETYEGVTFHSAQWNHDFDFKGKRVAVIGTGASAVQFVPELQRSVAKLTVFQRTPAWVLPRHDHEISEATRRLLRAAPGLMRLKRLKIYLQREGAVLGFRHPKLMHSVERRARRHLASQVSDPELRAKLTPEYRIGCKRILISNDYLRSLDQANVEVVTEVVSEITHRGVADGSGVEREFDAIIFGTGFRTAQLPLTDCVIGTAGQSMSAVWAGDPAAYLGSAVAGFPNAYLVHGPNIGLGHTSVIHMFESQAKYIADAIGHVVSGGLVAVEPSAEAQAQFVGEVRKMSKTTVWTTGGCTSWYLTQSGANSSLWPGTTLNFRKRTRQFDAAAHVATAPE